MYVMILGSNQLLGHANSIGPDKRFLRFGFDGREMAQL
jgi:hypothetical protein